MRAARLSVVTAVATADGTDRRHGLRREERATATAAVKVTATDSTCETSKKEVPAGQVTLSIENKGSKVTEVYDPLPGRPDRRRAREHRPRHQATLTAEVKAGDVRDRLQARA